MHKLKSTQQWKLHSADTDIGTGGVSDHSKWKEPGSETTKVHVLVLTWLSQDNSDWLGFLFLSPIPTQVGGYTLCRLMVPSFSAGPEGGMAPAPHKEANTSRLFLMHSVHDQVSYCPDRSWLLQVPPFSGLYHQHRTPGQPTLHWSPISYSHLSLHTGFECLHMLLE